MADANGSAPDFTHKLSSFEFEGRTFQRRKVPSREWAETLERVRVGENAEIAKGEKGLLFKVTDQGLFDLVRLAVREEDREAWDKLREEGRIEFGELAALKDWLWEQMMERPFTSPTPSSDGPGESSEASSREESSSPVETQAS